MSELPDRNQEMGWAPWAFRRKWIERSLKFCALIIVATLAFAFWHGDLELVKPVMYPTMAYSALIMMSYGGMALVEDIYKRIYGG